MILPAIIKILKNHFKFGNRAICTLPSQNFPDIFKVGYKFLERKIANTLLKQFE